LYSPFPLSWADHPTRNSWSKLIAHISSVQDPKYTLVFQKDPKYGFYSNLGYLDFEFGDPEEIKGFLRIMEIKGIGRWFSVCVSFVVLF
jgi:hypothetical protein